MKYLVLLLLLFGCEKSTIPNKADRIAHVPCGDSITCKKLTIDFYSQEDSIWELPEWSPYKDFQSIKKGDKFWVEYGMEYARFNVTKHDVKQRLIHGLLQNTINHDIWTECVWDYPQFRSRKHRIR